MPPPRKRSVLLSQQAGGKHPRICFQTALSPAPANGQLRRTRRYHEIQALRAAETHVLCPADPRYEATFSAAPEAAGLPDIQQDASRADGDDATLTHEMLPRGVVTTVTLC